MKKWSFFKCLKRNFKFAHLKEFNTNEHYNKTLSIQGLNAIIFYIIKGNLKIEIIYVLERQRNIII